MKIKLPDVTLVAYTGDKPTETIPVMLNCMNQIDFACAKIITTNRPNNLPEGIIYEKSVFPMDTYMKYNKYLFEEAWQHIETSHCLVIQEDSGILNPEIWDNNWLNFDWNGAPWPIRENSFIGNNGERARVGNGGFSLRSKRIMSLPHELGLPLTQDQNYWHEDGNFCVYYRAEMLKAGIKYAPFEVALKFSFETLLPENQNIKTFGYHKNLPPQYQNIYNFNHQYK